jgi:hypothetical protein
MRISGAEVETLIDTIGYNVPMNAQNASRIVKKTFRMSLTNRAHAGVLLAQATTDQIGTPSATPIEPSVLPSILPTVVTSPTSNIFGGPIMLDIPFGYQNLSQFLNTMLTAVIFLAAIVALFQFLLAALKFITAGDRPEGTKAARSTITNTVVGLLLLALVLVFFQYIAKVIPGLDSFIKFA